MSKELIFHAERKDFKIDTFRSGGNGGQHQNKTDSGVRITHIESGLSAECRETKSQAQNKKIAFRRLCKKLLDHYVPKLQKTRYAAGFETVRTYHEKDNRVVDHVSGLQQSYDEVMHDMTKMINTRNEVIRLKEIEE